MAVDDEKQPGWFAEVFSTSAVIGMFGGLGGAIILMEDRLRRGDLSLSASYTRALLGTTLGWAAGYGVGKLLDARKRP